MATPIIPPGELPEDYGQFITWLYKYLNPEPGEPVQGVLKLFMDVLVDCKNLLTQIEINTRPPAP